MQERQARRTSACFCPEYRNARRERTPGLCGDWDATVDGSWSIDFLSDALWDGRRFLTCDVIDNFSRKALAICKNIALDFIAPGRPMQNGFIQRFSGSFRRGVLDMHVCRDLGEVHEQTAQRLTDYNTEIPHHSLGSLTPAELRQYHKQETPNLVWH